MVELNDVMNRMDDGEVKRVIHPRDAVESIKMVRKYILGLIHKVFSKIYFL